MNSPLPRRRRLYLMRHGSVDYFLPDGTPVHPDTVALNAAGCVQADAAGNVFRQARVRFDRVWVSGLPRTVETASRVLAAAGLQQPLEVNEALQEIRPGRLADLPRDRIREAFLGAFQGQTDESARFLGGESIGEMLDRILPAFQAVLSDPSWDQALMVLHGAVNRGLLSYALAGRRCYLSRFEQAPGCINVIDVGPDDLVVRAVNVAPTQWLHERERLTTMEKLLAQYLRLGTAG
jgi:probable phosphoglycerate mutase